MEAQILLIILSIFMVFLLLFGVFVACVENAEQKVKDEKRKKFDEWWTNYEFKMMISKMDVIKLAEKKEKAFQLYLKGQLKI